MQLSGPMLATILGALFACAGDTEQASASSVGPGARPGGDSGSEASSAEASESGPEPLARDGGPREAAARASEPRTSGPAATGQGIAANRTPSVPAAGRGPLPDLVLDAAYLVDTTRFDIQHIDDPCALQQRCATGLGDRRVVRFGSRMGVRSTYRHSAFSISKPLRPSFF